MNTSTEQAVTIRTLNDSQCEVSVEQDGRTVTATATIVPFGSSQCVNFYPPLYPIGVPSVLVGEFADPRVLVRMVLLHAQGTKPRGSAISETTALPN